MTWKDKLEIGLKDDAPFRRDNVPTFQRRRRVPPRKPGDPTRSPEVPGAREDAEHGRNPVAGAAARRRSKRAC